MGKVPSDFLWGSATSAYQVEGASLTDGKGPSVQDTKKLPANTTDFKVASDHYHHFKEDIALFQELGLKAYRFSIAWSRILPTGQGEVNPAGLAFYDELINACIQAGIEPIVTMYHFDLPDALEQAGGWANRATIDAFVAYCQILFDHFGDRVQYWLTINEQNMMVLANESVLSGRKSVQQSFQENHHMLLAQAKVIKLYHELDYAGKIGPAPNIAYAYPASSAPEDILAAQWFNSIRNWLFLDVPVYGRYDPQAMSLLQAMQVAPEFASGDAEILAAGICDIIAFNYYNSNTVAANMPEKGQAQTPTADFSVPYFFKSVSNPHLAKTEFGWEIDPIGFRITLHELYNRYHKPLLITENGIGGRDELAADGKIHDDYRIQYLSAHIQEMTQAIHEGVDVIGYCSWSALDVVSTHEGMRKRYGLIYVNRTDTELRDLKRYPKDSFYWYQGVIRNGGV
ncbi:glycoside hydrolase family 1 protein [Lapidilactobacillus mulanensis]|uniref:Glycoside hydrolase family 1 protein n=1 Tax=Lapidilactobacillus mulanensis TaxID=2485999 RepID=A0ABW4DMK5_9LACO|nr:glycoside hydrolase family 1 protein [Lapidilactobacillus mulanensis]